MNRHLDIFHGNTKALGFTPEQKIQSSSPSPGVELWLASLASSTKLFPHAFLFSSPLSGVVPWCRGDARIQTASPPNPQMDYPALLALQGKTS